MFMSTPDKLEGELAKARKDYLTTFPADAPPLVMYNVSDRNPNGTHEELIRLGFVPILKYTSPHKGSPATVTMYIHGDFELCAPSQPPKPSV